MQLSSSFSYLLSFTLAASAVSSALLPITINDIPGTLTDGPSTVQLTAQAWGLDGPKVLNMNTTSFDWWYYDVVSSALDYSVVLNFWHAGPKGLWDGAVSSPDPSKSLYTSLVVTLPDGSTIYRTTAADELDVFTIENGSSAALSGTGWSWASLPDMSLYEIVIDDPETGVQGTITLQSTSPSQYPCGLASAAKLGDSIAFGEYLGWANAVPDANAVVDLTINGTQISFSGAGYHDQNWGPVPTQDAINSWYWGHGRVGPLNIVWFNGILSDGTEQSTNYIVQDGQVLAASCSGASVRPTGGNATFPPVHGGGPPGGFAINMTTDGGQTLQIAVAHKTLIASQDGTFYRWTGELSGGYVGGEQWNGTALYEQFAF